MNISITHSISLFFLKYRFIYKNVCVDLSKLRYHWYLHYYDNDECTLLQHRSPLHRVLFSGSIGIGKSVVLISLLKQPIITHSFRIGRASRCTSLQRHRHNGETLQARRVPWYRRHIKMQLGRVWIRGSIMNQLPRGFVHNGESSHVKDEEYKGRHSHAWRWRERAAYTLRAPVHVCRCCTREIASSFSPRISLRALFHRFCTNAPLSSYTDRFSFFFPALLSRSPSFPYACFLPFLSFFFLFSYDNHPIQLCPFETMAQVRRSHA